jgi:hypothetical protein
MLKALSPKEELKHRRESFAKLKEGTLFDLAQERFFIAAKKSDEKTWEVIELTEPNKKQIISGGACKHSVLRFDEMSCLNLRRN